MIKKVELQRKFTFFGKKKSKFRRKKIEIKIEELHVVYILHDFCGSQAKLRITGAFLFFSKSTGIEKYFLSYFCKKKCLFEALKVKILNNFIK